MPIIDTGQAKIFVREWGSGDPLLLIHGLGMSSELWVNQVEEFAARFRVVAVDLRGFGQSSKPEDPGSYSIERLAEDMASVIRELDLGATHILGSSMGGFTAQVLGLTEPSLCRSLLLCHTGPRMSMPEDVLASRIKALQESPMEDYANLVIQQALAPGADSSLQAWVREMLIRNDKRAYAQVLTEGLRDFNVADRVDQISVPSLVVIGELDRVIPPDEGRELAQKISGARLVEIKGVGHLGYAEQPAVFNKAVLSFLEAQ